MRSRRVRLEALETRRLLAGDVTVILAGNGGGTLDGFLSPTDGTILASDDPGSSGTLSIGALAQINSNVDVRIEATGSIKVAPDVSTLPITAGPGQTVTLTTDFAGGGDIEFESLFAGIFTSGANIAVTAGNNIIGGTFVSTGGDVSLRSGTQSAGGAVSVPAIAADKVTIDSVGTVTLTDITADALEVRTDGDILDTSETLLDVEMALFDTRTSGSISIGQSTGADVDVDTLSLASFGNVTFSDPNDIQLAQVNVSGPTSITAQGDLSDVGDVENAFIGLLGSETTLTAQNISLQDDNSTDDIFFFGNLSVQTTGNTTIHADTIDDVLEFLLLDDVTANNLTITTTGNVLGNQTGLIDIAGDTSIAALDDVTIGNPTADFSGTVQITGNDVTLIDSNDLTLGDIDVAGNLTVSAVDSIDDTPSSTIGESVNVTGTTSLAAINVNLDSISNDFTGAVSATAANVTLVDDNTLTLGDLDVTGSATVTAAGGDLLDSDAKGTGEGIDIAGVTSLSASGDIDLDDFVNDFDSDGDSDPVHVSATNAALQDLNALALGQTSVTADFTAGAFGDITDSNDGLGVQVGGQTSLLAQNIDLDNSQNEFTGPFSASALDISVSIQGDITLSDIDASEDLTLSGQSFTDSNAAATGDGINVIGETSITAQDDVSFLGSANDFGDEPVNITAASVSLNDGNAITLGEIDVTGGLTITASGDISDTPDRAINVAGITSLVAESGNDTFDILLDEEHEFGAGSVSITGNDLILNDVNGITLGTITATGRLTVSTGGDISDTPGQSINVGGPTSLVADSGNATFDIVLDEEHEFGPDPVSVTANDVILNDATGITLGTITATGGLTVTTGGDISDTPGQSVNVGGQTSLVAESGNDTFDIVLDEEHEFGSGSVSITGNDVILNDVNGITLGTITATGRLTVTTGGDISDTPGQSINVGGPTSLVADSGNDAFDILLDEEHEFGPDPVSITANDVILNDATGITLGTITTTGRLTVTTGGDISDTPGQSINVGGPTSLVAESGNDTFDILLDEEHEFGPDPISITGNDVILNDVTGITLGTITATGRLTVTTGGDISDTPGQSINVVGQTSLLAQSGNENFDIILDNEAEHNFDSDSTGDVVSAIGDDIFLDDLEGIRLGTITASGNAVVNAGSNVTLGETDSITASGSVSINFGTQAPSGSTANLSGIISASSTTITGSIGDDDIILTPSSTSPVLLDGGANTTTDPGDSLRLNLNGVLIDAALSDLEGPDGNIRFITPHQEITFIDIENSLTQPPAVTDIRVRGTNWNASSASVSILNDPSTVLPWTNINQIQVEFDRDVMLDADSLDLLGINTEIHAFLPDDPTDNVAPASDGFRYDPVMFIATYNLADSIDTDRLLIQLSGDSAASSPVTGTDGGLLLDGGNDVLQFFNVLPGDVTRDESVSVTDIVNVSTRVQPGTFNTRYDANADLNQDGIISVTDIVNVSSNIGNTLPNGLPLPSSQAPSLDTTSNQTDDDWYDTWGDDWNGSWAESWADDEDYSYQYDTWYQYDDSMDALYDWVETSQTEQDYGDQYSADDASDDLDRQEDAGDWDDASYAQDMSFQYTAESRWEI